MSAEIQKIQKPHTGEITLDIVRDKILTIQNKNVLLDSDVAALYGVETKRVNQAIQRNPGKFPDGYIIQLSSDEWKILKSQIATSRTLLIGNDLTGDVTNRDHLDHPTPNLKSQFVTSSWGGKNKLPIAFTEKGLYMLATILKSPRATATTIAID